MSGVECSREEHVNQGEGKGKNEDIRKPPTPRVAPENPLCALFRNVPFLLRGAFRDNTVGYVLDLQGARALKDIHSLGPVIFLHRPRIECMSLPVSVKLYNPMRVEWADLDTLHSFLLELFAW